MDSPAESLYRRYEAFALHLAFRMWRRVPAGSASLDDVRQIALLTLLECCASLEDKDDRFLKLLASRIVAAIRRASTARPTEEVQEDSAVARADQEQILIRRQDLARLAVAVGFLPDRERRFLILRFDDRMKLREIATEMEMSVSSAKSLLESALEQVRKTFEDLSVKIAFSTAYIYAGAKFSPSIAVSARSRRRQATINEFGRVSEIVNSVSPEAKALKVLRDEIQSWVETERADQSFVFEGAIYCVQVGEKARESEVDVKKTLRVLGAERFFPIVQVSLGELRQLVDGQRFHDLVTYERTGERRVVPVKRMLEMKAAA